MRRLLSVLAKVPLLAAFFLLAHPGHAQQNVVCDETTAAACSTTVNPGDGTQGDPAWLAFGKINANFDAIPTEFFNNLALSVAHGGTGQTSASAAINALLPAQTGFSGDCLGTNGSVASWIACGSGGSGLTSVGITVPSFLTASGSPLIANGTIALSYSGTPLPAANGGTGATSLAGANIPVLTGTINTGHCASFASSSSLQDGGICSTGFISGTLTSAQVLAAYPPASYGGASVLTTDMGMMACDGTRWNVVGTPPEPPGAIAFSYNHNVFTYFPVLADIGTGHTTSIGAFRIYSGYLGLNSSEPVVSTAFQTSTTTGTVGQLQLNYPSGTSNAAGVFTIVPYYTAPLSQDYGQAGLALGNKGFYVEIAYTDSSNNTDTWDTMFVEPQEHNPLQNDANPAYPGTYEQWSEFDVNESGHGTDYSGAYRGAYLQWADLISQPVTLASSYSSGATSISLASGWPYETGSSLHPWTITFNSGEKRTTPLVNGSTGSYALSSALSSNETSAATVNTSISFLSNSVTQTASLNYTVEHIFGGAYDPVGQTWNIWQDGVYQGQVSTAGTNSNTFRDTLHYMIVVAAQSHGANVVHSMTVRYVSMWTP